MTLFDLLLLVVLITSIGFAVIRGALKEFATLIAIAVAGGIAWVLSKPLLGVIGMSGSFFGTIAVIAVLLVIAFIGIYFGFHLLLRRVDLTGNASLANKIGGGVFGLVRALILIGLGFLGYSYYLDSERWPDSVKDAALLPIAQSSAAFFESFGSPEELEIPLVIPEDTEDTASLSQGYSSNERNNLSELVATVTTSDNTNKVEKKSSPTTIAEIISEDTKQSNNANSNKGR